MLETKSVIVYQLGVCGAGKQFLRWVARSKMSKIPPIVQADKAESIGRVNAKADQTEKADIPRYEQGHRIRAYPGLLGYHQILART